MGKAPAFQFYPADFSRDTAALSPDAVGVWMRILCIMWGAETRGRLTHTIREWGRIVGVEDDTLMQAILADLIRLKICDSEQGPHGALTLICRRWIREAGKRSGDAERAARYRAHHRDGTVTDRDARHAPSCKYHAYEYDYNCEDCQSLQESSRSSHGKVMPPSSSSSSLSSPNPSPKSSSKTPTRTLPRTLNEYLATEDIESRLRQRYPSVNLDLELTKMRNWAEVNPQKKKWAQFVVNWLNKALSDAQTQEPEGIDQAYLAELERRRP